MSAGRELVHVYKIAQSVNNENHLLDLIRLIINICCHLCFVVQSEVKESDTKTFTEEEMNQALKMQELLYQERLLKKDQTWNAKCKNALRERDRERGKITTYIQSQSQMT